MSPDDATRVAGDVAGDVVGASATAPVGVLSFVVMAAT
jgi:hypothetical protein